MPIFGKGMSGTYLVPEEVAEAVEFMLSQREDMIVSDLTLKPQIHRIKRKRTAGAAAQGPVV